MSPGRTFQNMAERVSQSPLKDQAFSTFLDQNPPFELPPENGISPSTKACPVQWTVIDNSATKRLEGQIAERVASISSRTWATVNP
jgi:hypothetical protein